MMKFEDLTVGQKNAFTTALECIEKKKHLTILGPAGTGKTTLMKFLVNELYRRDIPGVILAAPTHQAKKELSKATGRNANTLHSIFKINPVTLEECQLFEQRKTPDLSKARVLIIDEVSLPGRKLFDIVLNSIPSHCVIIAVGDKAQIRPVEPDGSSNISAFFTDPRFTQVELTEIRRQGEGSPIIQVATDIRNGKWIYPCMRDGQGVAQHTTFTDIMRQYFRDVKSMDDLFNTRMMAYTNATVDKLNEIVRKYLYKTDKPFIDGEVLVMQAPLMIEHTLGGKKLTEIVLNNGQYVRVLRAEENVITLRARGMDSIDIKYWRVEVETVDENEDDYTKALLNIIVDENEKNKMFIYQSKTAQLYKSGTVKARWPDYWKNKNTFHEVKAFPAQTIHKAQGSTFDKSYLLTGCIHKADLELAQQLLYVGATRAREIVNYL